MQDIISSIIETKLQIAQLEEQYSQKSHLLKELYEKTASLDIKIPDLTREIQSLLKSINELIAEKNSYRSLLELNKENSEEYRSPDQFLEIATDVDGIDMWTRILLEPDSPHITKKIKLMGRQGIPTKLRGEIWSRIIGNDLFITPKLFTNLLEASKNSSKLEKEENGTILIPMDLKRTLSSLQVFQERQPLHQSLSELLEAFAVFSI